MFYTPSMTCGLIWVCWVTFCTSGCIPGPKPVRPTWEGPHGYSKVPSGSTGERYLGVYLYVCMCGYEVVCVHTRNVCLPFKTSET